MLTEVFVAVMFTVGLAGIAVGSALIFLPAGLIVGGLLVAGTAALYVRGSAPTPERERPPPGQR